MQARRNELFALSGVRAKYPQLFVDGLFVGLFEEVEVQCGGLTIVPAASDCFGLFFVSWGGCGCGGTADLLYRRDLCLNMCLSVAPRSVHA